MLKIVAVALAVLAAASSASVEEEHSVERRLPAPCDCYVALGGRYDYVNMWKGSPCSGNSLGALYDGRCLYYAKGTDTEFADSPVVQREAECNGKDWNYYKMKTASGKSVGWVASEFMDCNYEYNPPAASLAALQSATSAKLPSADSTNESP